MPMKKDHPLLIYHRDSKIYEEILLKRLPRLLIRPAVHPNMVMPADLHIISPDLFVASEFVDEMMGSFL